MESSINTNVFNTRYARELLRSRANVSQEDADEILEELDTRFNQALATKPSTEDIKDIIDDRLQNMATKEFVKNVVAISEANLRTEIQGVRTEMQSVRTEMQGVRTEIQSIKTDVQAQINKMQMVLVSTVLGFGTIMGTMIVFGLPYMFHIMNH